MTMQFRVVKEAVRTILGDAAAGRYQTIGFQRQQKAAEAHEENNRLVEVYFKSENFDKSKGRLNGPTQGDVGIAIELTVSSAASVDLSVINNPSSTPEQLQTAMSEFKEASFRADDSFDEFADIIYQIMMDARNIELGLGKGVVSNRWVSAINKSDPNPRGQLVVLTGFLEFSCNVSEDVLGDETGKDIDTISSVTGINNDTVQKTGVEVKY